MGNTVCLDNCYSLLRGHNETTRCLRKLYKEKYRMTLFYNILRNILKESQIPEAGVDDIHTKKSMLESNIYEEQRIFLGNEDSHTNINNSERSQ